MSSDPCSSRAIETATVYGYSTYTLPDPRQFTVVNNSWIVFCK